MAQSKKKKRKVKRKAKVRVKRRAAKRKASKRKTPKRKAKRKVKRKAKRKTRKKRAKKTPLLVRRKALGASSYITGETLEGQKYLFDWLELREDLAQEYFEDMADLGFEPDEAIDFLLSPDGE